MTQIYVRSLILSLLVVLAFAFAIPALAADSESMPMVSEAIDVRLVNLEAFVTEKGLSVQGLSPKDFRLKVDGEERPIEFFTEVRDGVAVSLDTERGTADLLSIPTVERGEPVGTSYLVFIDEYFSLASDRDRVLEGLRDEIDRLRPEDRMAIVAYDGNRLDVLSSWTQSTAELNRALVVAQSRPTHGLQRWSERRSSQIDSRLPERLRYRRSRFAATGLGSSLAPDEYFYARQLEGQVDRQALAVAASLRSFAAAPGRRVAILLSGGWPYDIPSYVANKIARPVTEPGFMSPTELYRPIVETANILGYTLYPVDLPGLQSSILGATAAGLASDFLSPRSTTWERERQFHDALEHLAQETGGIACLNATRASCLPLASADTDSYYWIGFTPQRRSDDQQWKIELEVKRAGTKIRTRKSFTDLSPEREIGLALESALLFESPPSPRPLVARLAAGEKSGWRKIRAPLTVEIPRDAVKLLPGDGDKTVAELELRVAALGRNGSIFESSAIPLSLEVEQQAAGLVYETDLELRPETERLVVAVYDRASGAILMSALDVTA